MAEKFNTQFEEIKERFIKKSPFMHPDLRLVTLSGSFSNNSNGALSDIDVTTVLQPENPSRVDVSAIIALARQLHVFAQDLANNFLVAPVVISSIRLEEAQIALAKTSNHKVLPIHWLFYPSVEFASVNEPSELFLNLIKGQTIFGNQEQIQDAFEVAVGDFSSLTGLDWLTDSLRVLLANIDFKDKNRSFLPQSFLKSLAMHNLEYFWKWRIIDKLAKQLGVNFQNYNQLDLLQINPELKQVVELVRKNRHLGEKADLQEITKLHDFTFQIWPKINQLK
jgi:hypothetical protein